VSGDGETGSRGEGRSGSAGVKPLLYGITEGRVARESDWTATLREIIEQMTQAGVAELDVRQGDLRIRLRRSDEAASAASDSSAIGDPRAEERRGPEPHRVLAPLTGIYYASPNPSAKAYVEIGDWVEESTGVGLIETMKVFTEVTAECQGRVVSILVQQGQLVQAGDPMVLIDATAVPDSPVEVG
jgi:acetyl-CoA carboxylase biotin carboxyl carrier protein